ncbi:MAG: polymer-forming cytoskeletal protein, partial [Pseudomonadota bacterium]|nr:polymer-forming cytoskeletal protein [Pseudomonadota bacterium]
LVLSELGRIEGEIRVSNVVINGAVLGSIHASEYVELQVKANVTGNVCYKSMEIQQGAVVQGKLVHSDETSDKIVSFKSASGLES